MDHTVGEFERIIEARDRQAIYSFEYTDEAKVFSPVISTANGDVLEIENDEDAWIFTVWMPERTNLADLWEDARRHDIDIELLRVNEYASLGTTDRVVRNFLPPCRHRPLISVFEPLLI